MLYENIEIHWLHATVLFGSDPQRGVWPVTEESDGTFRITVDQRTEDGKTMIWDIPFDISQTLPSPSGESGHRILPGLLETSGLQASEQITVPGKRLFPPEASLQEPPE